MSQNISMPAARVPLVDERGQITREWMQWFLGMFQRVGGPVGFSNAELYGDAVALQSYDELLERISALEAKNRGLSDAVWMMATMPQDFVMPAQAISEILEKLEVRGDTRLASERGNVVIGAKSTEDSEQLQVTKDLRVKEGVKLAVDDGVVLIGTETQAGDEKLQVQGGIKADEISADSIDVEELLIDTLDAIEVKAVDVDTVTVTVLGNQVVGSRQTGFPVMTAYAGQSVGATYSQSQAQTTDDAVKTLSQKLVQLNNALRSHGLIGD